MDGVCGSSYAKRLGRQLLLFMNYYNQFIIMYGRNPRVAFRKSPFGNLIRGILVIRCRMGGPSFVLVA